MAVLDKLLSPSELAQWAGVPVATVYRWNYTGTGPRPIRVGKHVRYRQRDVEDWLERQAGDQGPNGRAA